MKLGAPRLVDDDGVLVIASARSLERRWASGGFDHDFPRALLAGMGAAELLAWRAGFGGDVEVAVLLAEPVPDGPSSRERWPVELDEGDELLVLPYSQYTFCCDRRRGVPERIEGLSARLAVPPGRYDVAVRRLRGEAPLRFEVYLTRAVAESRCPPVVEGLPDPREE